MSQPLRPNFGCGTLMVLAVAIFAASRFVPHGQSLKSKDPTVRAQTAAVKPKTEPTGSPQSSDPSISGSNEADSIIQDSISLLSTWLDQKKASPTVHPEMDKPNKVSPAVDTPLVAKPEAVSAIPPKESPKIALDRAKEEGGPTPANGWLDTLKSAGEKVDAVMHPPESKPNPGTAAPLAGEIVFNNPWDQSVDQVARYLKKHTHDAASLTILEWGKVTKNTQGYEVRCTFRSKNVLGREITQTRTFVLGKAGEIKDIRD